MKQGIQRFWLVRHGITIWNSEQRMCGHSDIPLSREGRVQARWLARRLQQEPVAAIYSSDLFRARETAKIIATSNNIPVHVSSAWREINFGAWEGLTYAEIAEQFQDKLQFFDDPLHTAPPAGESLTKVVERVETALTEIIATKSTEGDIVVVSHGGPLRALLCRMLSIPLAQQWQLRIDPGSLSTLDVLLSEAGHTTPPTGILTMLNAQRPIRTLHH